MFSLFGVRYFSEKLLFSTFCCYQAPNMGGSSVAVVFVDRKFFRILASKKYSEGGVALVWQKVKACRRGRSVQPKPAKPVVLWAARVQIPHPAPPFAPRNICSLQCFSHKIVFLLRFRFLALSGLSFIHILDLNRSFSENNIVLDVFQVCRYVAYTYVTYSDFIKSISSNKSRSKVARAR